MEGTNQTAVSQPFHPFTLRYISRAIRSIVKPTTAMPHTKPSSSSSSSFSPVSAVSKRTTRLPVHCPDCRQLFRVRSLPSSHKTSGVCARFFCRVTDHEHQLVDQTFDTVAAAKVWIVQQLLDQIFVICFSSGEYVLYRCRFHGKPSSKPESQDDLSESSSRKRAAPVAVPNLGCRVTIRMDRLRMCQCPPEVARKEKLCRNWSSVIRVRGCLNHSHPMQNQFLRMSRVCQDYLVSLLKTGLDKPSILRMYLNSGMAQEGDLKCITFQDLRNLERKYVKPRVYPSQNPSTADIEADNMKDEGEVEGDALDVSVVRGRGNQKDPEKDYQRRVESNIDELRVHLFNSSVTKQAKMTLLRKLEALNSEARLENSVFAQGTPDEKRPRKEPGGENNLA